MCNEDALCTSAGSEIDDLISAAIIKFKNNESIESDLLKINGDGDKFNEWAWGIELGERDYILLECLDDFLIPEDVSETFEDCGLDLKSDVDILKFIASHLDDESKHWESAIYYKIDEVFVGVKCEIHGQGGPHFLDFGIYTSEEQYFESLADAGYICFLNNTVVSHTASAMVSIFKKSVTEKYYP